MNKYVVKTCCTQPQHSTKKQNVHNGPTSNTRGGGEKKINTTHKSALKAKNTIIF